jgi:hypothetical protein
VATRRRRGLVVVLAAVLLVGGAGVIAWMRAQEAERADQRPTPLGPDPRSPEAAVEVAKRFHEHMAQRRFVEALPLAEGPAAELVARELGQRVGSEGQRDPDFFKLVDGALAASVVSFETTSVTRQDAADAVAVRARAVLLAEGKSFTVHPRFLVHWRFDEWAVKEFEADERAPASAPVPTR